MIFVVSTGRSGTTSIARLLTAVDGIICLHEPNPALIRESSAYRYGEMSPVDLQQLLRATRPFSVQNDLYCESSQTLALIIPILVDAFPQARCVWLLRNGLDVVASAMQKQWYTGHSENHERYEDCTPTQQAWIDGRLQGDKCGAIDPPQWASMSRFEKCCWYWRYVNDLIAYDLKTWVPGNFFYLRLEMLQSQVPVLLRWIGIEPATVSIESIPQANPAKRPPYHWTQWSAGERNVFEQWCGVRMDEWYPGWRSPDGIWQGVEYETPPQRRRWRFWWQALRRRG